MTTCHVNGKKLQTLLWNKVNELHFSSYNNNVCLCKSYHEKKLVKVHVFKSGFKFSLLRMKQCLLQTD